MNMAEFIEGNNFQAAFGNRQAVDRNLAGEKNLVVKSAVGHPMIRPDITSDKFKLHRG